MTYPLHLLPKMAILVLLSIFCAFMLAVQTTGIILENIVRLTRGRHLITAGGRIGATQVNAGTT
jgi:hypothetical protein